MNKRLEEIERALAAKVGTPVEVEDIRSGARVTLKFLGPSGGGLLSLEWTGGVPHPVEFRRKSGCGIGETKHYKVTELGRHALGLPAFGKETAFFRNWRTSLAASWGNAR